MTVCAISAFGRCSRAHAVALSICILRGAVLAGPVSAQIATATGGDPAPAAASIDTDASRVSDADIAERLRGIFGEIEGLTDVRISVREGVVVLDGSARTAEDIGRAEALAQRLVGVVTVENRIDRDLTVDENLAPALVGLRDDFDSVVAALPLVALALTIGLAIAVAGYLLAGFDRLWRWVTPNNFLAELVASSLRVLFILLGLFVVLDILDATAALGAILGGAGVIGLAIGFALRDTVDNYISSIMLSLRQPFRPYDHVVIGAHEGRVVRLTSRATILMTLEGNHLRIPNATVFKAEILNYSRNPQRRFSFELGVDAEDDPASAIETGLAAINGQDFVLNDPEATAEIREVGDSNILITFHGWIDQRASDFNKARGAAIRVTKNALENSGFALPEPIYRLRFDNAVPASLASLSEEKPGDASGRKSRKATTEEVLDVSPEDHVEKLVDSERSDDGSSDLLDDQQPVE